MKRNSLQRLSSFLPKPKNRLTVQELESRDVPAAFFVDPAFAGGAPVNNYSGEAAANFGSATPTNTFAGLDQAIAAAAGSLGGDTIYLANGTIVIQNIAGGVPGTPIVIGDDLTLVGGGASKTTLIVGYQVDYVNLPYSSTVFETYSGSSLNLQDFTYNGSGVAANTAFYYEGASSTIKSVDFIGYGTGFNGNIFGLGNEGQAVWARSGANISVSGGTFTNTQGRSGVYASSGGATSILTVDGTTFNGSPSGSGRDSYGVEVAANANATISKSTFTQHLGNSGGQGSAGLIAYAVSGFNPEITVLRNTFSNNTVAIVAGFDGEVGDKTSGLIAYNNITGSGQYSIQGNTVNNGQIVNARFNWFGSATGPSGTSTTLGMVNTSQFLRAPLGTVEPAAVSNKARFVTAPNSSSGGEQPVGYFSNATGAGFAATATPTGKAYPLRNTSGALVTETGETRTAFVDLNGDGFNEIIVSSGTSELVSIYNGVGGVWIKSFSGLTQNNVSPVKFAGGVYVAGGDINGDGTRDLIVSQGGFDPRVIVYNGKTILTATPTRIADFIDATNRSTLALGVTVASGDFNGDGFDDIVTGVIGRDNSNVRVFDGKSLLTNGNAVPNANPALALNRMTDNVTPNVDFFAYPGFATGVYVAAADVNGDGRAELVTGTQKQGANLRVYTFAPGSLFAPTTFASGTSTPTLAADFLVGGTNAGVRVAARDLNNDGYADILWTLGTGSPPVGVINGKELTLTGPASGTTPPASPVGFTLLTAAYSSASKGAFVA